MKKMLSIIVFACSLMMLLPINVYAVDTNKNTTTTSSPTATTGTNKTTGNKQTSGDTTIDMGDYNQSQNCDTLLGNPSDSNSVAWLINKILTYATIIGCALVVVLSSMDFLKVIANSDDDQMTKASKKLAVRLMLAALLFFVPTITNVMLGIFGLTSDATCGIQQN